MQQRNLGVVLKKKKEKRIETEECELIATNALKVTSWKSSRLCMYLQNFEGMVINDKIF